MSVFAFDLGGTFLRCGVFHGHRIVGLERLRLPHRSERRDNEIWQFVIDRMADYVRRFLHDATGNDEVVISFPGPVADRRRPLCAPTVGPPNAFMEDMATLLRRRVGLPVSIINDVSAAAWHVAEHLTADRFMIVTVSSGVGSKVFDRHHRSGVLDVPPYAGEIGHVVVDTSPDAVECECGGRGHLGAIASGRGAEALARRQAAVESATFARSACQLRFRGNPGTLSNEEHLVPAARAGDVWAWGVIRKGLEPLGQALAFSAHAIGVQSIVVIGGFALALGKPYELELNRAIAGYSSGSAFGRPQDLVRLWDVSEDPCLAGVVAYACARVGA